MSAIYMPINELRLLMRSAFTRVIVVLTAALAILGTRAVDHADAMHFHGMGRTSLTMSLGASQYAALAGAALFAMLTLLVMSRDRRQRSRSIIEAAGGHGRVTTARIVALLGLALLTALATLIITFLAHCAQSSAPYEPSPYLFSLGLILLPALWFAILIAATLDLVFENLDIAFLSFGVIYFIGFTSPNYLLRWVQTGVSVYSDFGGIEPVGRLVVYNRLVWACAVTSAVLAGFTCRRLPGFSLRASLARNSGRGILPITAFAAIAVSAWVYANEPHLFPRDSVFQKGRLPRSEQAWLETAECHTELQTRAKTLAVEARYGFGKEPGPVEIEFITNAGLRIEALTINGTDAAWSPVPDSDRVRVNLPAGPRADVEFRYQGRIRYPRPGGLPGYITDRSVYLLEESHWLFEPLTQAKGPVRMSGSVTAPAHLTVVTPGRLESVAQEGDRRTWRFAATAPELTIGLFAAEYSCQTFNDGPATVEFYFSPKHETYIREARIADHIRDMLAFYQELMGLSPFDDLPLKIVETSVYKPGGHASLNVITLAEYMLNRARVSDPKTDPRLILRDLKILAHELAHQWWGSGVAVAESGAWSSEGLAEYMAYSYLTARYSHGITHNISGGWRGSASAHKYAYYRKDPQALERMRPALREKLLQNETKGRVYSVLPLRLLAAEEHAGQETIRNRLAEVFQRYRGRTLGWQEFTAIMGPGVIDLEKEEP
jgi:hypothetical protein